MPLLFEDEIYLFKLLFPDHGHCAKAHTRQLADVQSVSTGWEDFLTLPFPSSHFPNFCSSVLGLSADLVHREQGRCPSQTISCL